MDAVDEAGPPPKTLTLYTAGALLGVILMLVGLVGGAVLKDISVIATVSTILPGIALLLLGIWGYGREQA
jgi:amino acid transporter